MELLSESQRPNTSSSYRPPSVYAGRVKYRFKHVLKLTDNKLTNTDPIHVQYKYREYIQTLPLLGPVRIVDAI